MPYFIFVAPNWIPGSMGADAFHALAQHVEDRGFESYLLPCVQNPKGKTRLLTQKDAERLRGEKRIVVYPEMTPQIMTADRSVRWMLASGGLYNEGEERFYWDAGIAQRDGVEWPYHTLCTEEIDPEIFYPGNEKRQGFCLYVNKHKGIVPDWIRKATFDLCSIRRGDKMAVADALRRHRFLYCPEESAVITEAGLCGCIALRNFDPVTSEVEAKAREWMDTRLENYRANIATIPQQIDHFIDVCTRGL